MPVNKRLILAHLWLGFAGFLGALVLGEWQMFIRSPLHAWMAQTQHSCHQMQSSGQVA